ncbi:MAG: DUF3365 domain-containing protein [Pleurocapsa sp.]
MSLFSKIKKWFLKLLYDKIIYILVILFVAGIAIAISSMFTLSHELIESQALQSAEVLAQSLRESRSLYSSEIVNRIKNIPGVEVTHNYSGKSTAIPIPATYLIELNHRISENNLGTSVRLYSRYPFSWRKAGWGIRDEFEEEAITFLEKNPQEVFYRIEEMDGNPTLRYAQPDIMKPSCVACHNSHPDSPKRDWKVGQLRGVLEVKQPLNNMVLQSRNSLSKTSFQLGGISLLAVLGIILVLARFKLANQKLNLSLKKTTSELNNVNVDLQTAKKELTQLTQLTKLMIKIDVDQDERQKEVNEIVDCTTFDSIAELGKKWRSDNKD